MRSDSACFELVVPRSLAEALAMLQASPGAWSLVAGGTDVMVLFEAGMLNARRWLGINRLAELKGISVTDAAVELGALTTYTEVIEHPVLRAEFPSLARAAVETGGLAIQNRGTLGGNIANASPAADSPPALLAYDAALELRSAGGARWVPYASFHTGYKRTLLAPDELITRIRLPRVPERRHFYRKVGTRKAQAISKVVLCAAARRDGGKLADVRVAIGSVAPTVVRCVRTERLLSGQAPTPDLAEAARAMLEREIAPIDDIRSTADYRRAVAGNVLVQCLNGWR